jgi:signal transduction histidine kinase
MIFAASIDLLIAIILYFYGAKQEATKWSILFFIFACLGSLSFVIVESILPALQIYKVGNHFVNTALFDMHIAFFFILQACTPYAFTMFTIVYSEAVLPHIKNVLAYALVLPIIMTWFITPMKPDIQLDFIILLLWTAPYYLVGCFLLISSYLKEKNPRKRRGRLITVCFFVPPIIMIVVLNHFNRAFYQNDQGFRYISLFVGAAFVVFIISAIRYGALGVKIKFEQQKLDQTIKGIASGTSMLNHAMKNRIVNIDMLAGRLKVTAQLLQHKEMGSDTDLILAETQQMLQMVKRIHKQIEDIEIVEGSASLDEIIALALQSNKVLLESKGIIVVTDCSLKDEVICDRIHLQEVFSNLIRNALDAMEVESGKLGIKIYERKADILIEFADNGSGIDKEIADKIFEPFFSTKHSEENFGLGLSYCYLVLQKHGGKIAVASQQDGGTMITVYLPKHRKL